MGISFAGGGATEVKNGYSGEMKISHNWGAQRAQCVQSNLERLSFKSRLFYSIHEFRPKINSLFHMSVHES